jgi:DNA-binding transcriptional ArsR family regulator
VVERHYLRVMDRDLLVSLRALSDASRLRIVGVLAAGKRMAVEDLAAAILVILIFTVYFTAALVLRPLQR